MGDSVIKDEEFECVDHDAVMSSAESDVVVVSIASKTESLAKTNHFKPNARTRHNADGAPTQSKHHKCEDDHDSESTDATSSDDTESVLPSYRLVAPSVCSKHANNVTGILKLYSTHSKDQ